MHDDHAAACHAGQSPAKASRLSCACTVCLCALIRILLVSHLSCFWSLAASARTLADALRVLLRMSDASSGRCVWLAERVNGSNHRARMNKLGVATFRQNLSLHPEDWHCACFRPVFWLAFFLHRRLPMRFSSYSGFLSVSSGLQQRGLHRLICPYYPIAWALTPVSRFTFPLNRARHLKASLSYALFAASTMRIRA